MKAVLREHKLEARRKWREKNKDRIKVHNENYIKKIGKEELKLRRIYAGK